MNINLRISYYQNFQKLLKLIFLYFHNPRYSNVYKVNFGLKTINILFFNASGNIEFSRIRSVKIYNSNYQKISL